MKTTPFTEKHIALGAKMHEFAGYNMPIEYSGILDEHHTVCQSVGVFDVSHMGEFWVKGPHALEFIQQVTSNNAAVLTPGKCSTLVSRMKPEVSSMTCLSIFMNPINICWWSMQLI